MIRTGVIQTKQKHIFTHKFLSNELFSIQITLLLLNEKQVHTFILNNLLLFSFWRHSFLRVTCDGLDRMLLVSLPDSIASNLHGSINLEKLARIVAEPS